MNKSDRSKPKKANLESICQDLFVAASLPDFQQLLNNSILNRLGYNEDTNFPLFIETAKEDIYHLQQLGLFLTKIHGELNGSRTDTAA